jgi:DNA-binding transcriptional regulator LsrR (DeoR family)
MASPRQAQKDLVTQQAAFLCGVHEMTQKDIGQLLGRSQPRVSRLLMRAEERGWLRRSYQFIPNGISQERLEELKRVVKPNSLEKRLAEIDSATGVRVRDVHVVDSGSGEMSERRFKRFGRAAAEPLVDLIARSDVCAVTWGKTVSRVVDNCNPELWRRIARSIRFVPVCGEPLDQASDRDTSTHLAERLHKLVQSTGPVPLSLTGVPALIARRYSKPARAGIRRLVNESGSYQEVFGTKSPLIAKVDALLTSVGPADKPMGFIHEELLKAGSTKTRRLTKAILERLVVGDIGGVLIPRPGIDGRSRREVDALNAMWTGAKREHMERIALDAARGTRPGVIVVSMGDDGRSEMIAELVRQGLVNELIIDRELSEALVKALR